MGRKRKDRTPFRGSNARPEQPKKVFTSPFKDLGKLLAEGAALQPKPGAAPIKSPKTPRTSLDTERSSFDDPGDEEAMLSQALEGVRPLDSRRATRLAAQPPTGRAIVSEDAEVMAHLYDLVSGQGEFALTETDQYIEGARVGLDPRLVTRLRKGEFPIQSHIDLHGMTQPAAKTALSDFVRTSVRNGLRAVLVVHGRGRGSPAGLPVLKHATAQWLSHGALGGHVLAFTTARPADGGAGAMYVLLRRARRRAAFDVLEGAKRRD